MIRPRHLRLGLVQAGDGGSASTYSFDPDTGLSNDPSLAYYLQDLTPAQLQTALTGQSPTSGLISLLQQDITGTGAGSLPCGTAANPTCGPAPTSGVPTWAWAAGAGLLALIFLTRR